MFTHPRSSLDNHTWFQTKMGKDYTRFQTKRRKNATLWVGTYLYGLYKGVPPLPQGAILYKVDSVSVVVQFYPWFKFYFLLFRGYGKYDHEFETNKQKN